MLGEGTILSKYNDSDPHPGRRCGYRDENNVQIIFMG